MRFFSPWGFLLFITLPAIFAMWFLKLKGQEQTISSNLIWNRIMSSSDRGQPFDKLKKNILLYLQLLAALLAMLAVTNPYVDFLGGKQSSVIFVLDNSGSMSSKYEQSTGFIEAKKQIETSVRNGSTQESYSLVEAGNSPETVVYETTDKGEFMLSTEGLKQSYGTSDLDAAVELARAAAKENGARIEIYSDHKISLNAANERLHIVNQPGENWGISKINGNIKNDGTAVVTVTNYGLKKGSRDISIFADNKLSDVGTIELEPGKTGQLVLNVVKGAKELKAVISEEDSIEADNTCYFVPEKGDKKVALVGRGSVFIEKAVQLVDGIQLYKLESDKPLAKGYDMYIFDGVTEAEQEAIKLKELLPESVPVMLIGGGYGIVEESGKVENAIIAVGDTTITKQMDGESFAIREGYSAGGKWGQDIGIDGNKALIRYGEYRGRKISYIGFNLSDSDFPLNTAFPVVMDGLFRFGVDLGARGEGNWHCGESIRFSVPTDATTVSVKTPSGEKLSVKPGGSETYLADSRIPGNYIISGKGTKSFEFKVPVNYPAEESVRGADISGTLKYSGNGLIVVSKGVSGKYLRNILVVLLLMGIFAEGEVYRRGL